MNNINNSIGFPNWSQRNNTNSPLSTCNVTSAIDAAECCHFDIQLLRKTPISTPRPPDDLLVFGNKDAELTSIVNRDAPGYPWNQYMPTLALGLGKWLGFPDHVEWHPSLQLSIVQNHIKNGGCAIVHGHYPCQESTGLKYIDHITCLVGVSYEDDGTLNSFLVDDPYGDYRTQYTIDNGNNIPMPLKDALAYLKNQEEQQNCIDAILVYKK